MGDVLNIQAKIGRFVMYKEIEDQVGTTWEGIMMANHIAIQGISLDLQAKEGMYKIKSRSLSVTTAINSDLQTTIDVVKNIK